MKKNKGGRPTKYTKKIGDKICERIMNGESVRSIVKDNNIPSSSTIFRWLLDDNKKEFWEQYEKARNVQAEIMFEELLEIPDDRSYWVLMERREEEGWWQQNKEAIGISRLRIDTRKWYLSKVFPKKFGHRVEEQTLEDTAWREWKIKLKHVIDKAHIEDSKKNS